MHCHQLRTSCTAILHCYYVIHVITACEDHLHLQCHQHTRPSLTRKTRTSVTLLYLITRSSKFCFSCCSDSAFPVMMKCSWCRQLCTSCFMTDTTLIITQRRVDTTETSTLFKLYCKEQQTSGQLLTIVIMPCNTCNNCLWKPCWETPCLYQWHQLLCEDAMKCYIDCH